MRVADVDVACAVHGNAHGRVQQRRRRQAAIAAKSLLAAASHRADDPGQVDFANDVVVGVGNVQVARRVEGQSAGLIESDVGRLHAGRCVGMDIGARAAHLRQSRLLRRVLRIRARCPNRGDKPCNRGKHSQDAQRPLWLGGFDRIHRSLGHFHSFPDSLHRACLNVPGSKPSPPLRVVTQTDQSIPLPFCLFLNPVSLSPGRSVITLARLENVRYSRTHSTTGM